MYSTLVIPLLNPNETEVLIVRINVNNGQLVQAGEPICTLETTKSTADLEAPQAGYIQGLILQAGQTVHSGTTFCYISTDPEWQPPPENQPGEGADSGASTEADYPSGLRITQPALKLARQLGLALESLPIGQLITESTVRSVARNIAQPEAPETSGEQIDPEAIIVYGAGGHGKSVIELIQALDVYRIHGIIDDDRQTAEKVAGIPVLGGAELLPRLRADGIGLAANAVGGIGAIGVRVEVFEKLSRCGFSFPTLIHPRALIEPSARIAAGVQVMPLAYIGSDSKIGFGCIVNTGAIVSHDCTIGEHANIAPGAILAGEVVVEEQVLVGMGVTVNLRVRIGSKARLGNSSTVKADVPENGIVRAGATWPG